MSQRIGKNHARNIANRKPKVKYPTNRVLVQPGEQANARNMREKHDWFERNK